MNTNPFLDLRAKFDQSTFWLMVSLTKLEATHGNVPREVAEEAMKRLTEHQKMIQEIKQCIDAEVK